MNRNEREKLHRRRGFLPELVFAWKVRRRGDFARFLVALLITSAGLSGAAMVFRVQGGERTGIRRATESARVVILRPDDAASRALLEWAREASPFPDRWDPMTTEGLRAAMTVVDTDLHEASRYLPKLYPGEELSDLVVEPGVLTLWDPALPKPSPPPDDRLPSATPTQVRAVALPGKRLASRWRPLEESWEGLEFYKLLGKEAKFVVGVNERGRVEFCLPSAGLDPLLDQQMQNWVREHRFKPAEEAGIVWDTVTVAMRVANQEPGAETEQKQESGAQGEDD